LLDLILKGVVTGFILSIMIGPVFFVLLETSIRKGVRSAIAFDIGVLFSDFIYILIAYVFYSQVASLTGDGKNNEHAKIVGGILFIIYGIVTFFKKLKAPQVDDEGNIIQNQKDYFLLFLKGFLLNFANPFVIFYWFSVMTLASKQSQSTISGGDSTPIMYFIAVMLITFFSFDLLKIIGAKKLRPLVTDNLLKALNQLTGIVFLGFGIFLIIKIIIGKP
jgi:threonine/homoserine/homoserine lactone efflux protein